MATNRIYFATNRTVLGESPAEFGTGYNEERPFLYRVGRVGVTHHPGRHPWRDGDATYSCGQAELYPETPAGEAQAEIPGSTAMFDEMRATMRDDPRDALVFLHGFANSFESAMCRAAELRDAYLAPMTDPESGALAARGREPLAFAFAWPSDAKLFLDDDLGWAYSSDRRDARNSGQAMGRAAMRLFDYLSSLAREERCLQRVHLVAHSMGNWALRHALQELLDILREDGRPLRRVFETVFLMASDIEDDALEKDGWLAPLFDIAQRVAVYHAGNDRALSLSDAKPNQGDRLGHRGPRRISALPDRVEAIDCAEVSWTPADGLQRHQYYRLAPEVLRDVRAVLAGKTAAEMSWRRPAGDRRWRLTRDGKAREALDAG